mmetsp:Transcript_11244/g.25549  ORF Transcript_11244/g.25549 Transcript_11244/m.25549 type:complete len:1368 (+) Transcript_11244:64-4167(+)
MEQFTFYQMAPRGQRKSMLWRRFATIALLTVVAVVYVVTVASPPSTPILEDLQIKPLQSITKHGASVPLGDSSFAMPVWYAKETAALDSNEAGKSEGGSSSAASISTFPVATLTFQVTVGAVPTIPVWTNQVEADLSSALGVPVDRFTLSRISGFPGSSHPSSSEAEQNGTVKTTQKVEVRAQLVIAPSADNSAPTPDNLMALLQSQVSSNSTALSSGASTKDLTQVNIKTEREPQSPKLPNPPPLPAKAETGPMKEPSWASGGDKIQAEITAANHGQQKFELPVPGASFLGFGYDGKRQCSFEECATLPIIKYTYEKNRKVVTPAGEFILPDQLRLHHRYETTAKTEVFSSFSQVEQSMAVEAEVSGSYMGFSGGASAAYSQSSGSTSESYYSNRKVNIDLYGLSIRIEDLEASCNPTFYQEYKALPTRFLDNPRTFLRFLQRWGPYLILDAEFGGTLEMTMVTAKSDSYSSMDVQAAVEAEYNGIAGGAKGSASFAMSEKSKNVQANSMIALHSNGGDPAVARAITDVEPGSASKMAFRGDFEAWVQSISHFPRCIDSVPKLTEIYKIIPTSSEDSIARRNALELAAAIYVGDKTNSLSNLECTPGNPSPSAATGAAANDQKQVTQNDRTSITWANYNRIRFNECVRFAARGPATIDIVFANVISQPRTWYHLQIGVSAVKLFAGDKMVESTTAYGSVAMGSNTLFEDYWACIFDRKISYGKGPHEYLTWVSPTTLIPPRFYGFGCGAETQFASIQKVKPDCAWMGSATSGTLSEVSGIIQIPASTRSQQFSGEGIQINDCHAWTCTTYVSGNIVPRNGQNSYPATVTSSTKLSCDLDHLAAVEPDYNAVTTQVKVTHLQHTFDASVTDGRNLIEKNSWSYFLTMNRCPGVAVNNKWESCGGGHGTCVKAGAAWTCRCAPHWSGDLCGQCAYPCGQGAHNPSCNGCQPCLGHFIVPDCQVCDIGSINSECEEADRECTVCRRCKPGLSGDTCFLSWRWEIGPWSSCDVDCGGGRQYRSVKCKQGGYTEDRPDSACVEARLGPKESTERVCNAQPCTGVWTTSAWAPAVPLCGSITQTREVNCACAGHRCPSPLLDHARCWSHSTKPDSFQRVSNRECFALDYRPHLLSQSAGENVQALSLYAPNGGMFTGPGGSKAGGTRLSELSWPSVSVLNHVRLGSPPGGFISGLSVYTNGGNPGGHCLLVEHTGEGKQTAATCPDHTAIVGGGCWNTAEPYALGWSGVELDKNRWSCGSHFSHTRYKATALCCVKTMIQQRNCGWRFKNAQHTNQAESPCNPGEVVYSGGCYYQPKFTASTVSVKTSQPTNNLRGWFCQFETVSAGFMPGMREGVEAITAEAYCCAERFVD